MTFCFHFKFSIELGYHIFTTQKEDMFFEGHHVPRYPSFCTKSSEDQKKGHLVRRSVAHPFGKGGTTTGDVGLKPPTANEFLRFSHKKNTHFSTLFIEKGHAVIAAVIMDNAKIFS